MTHNPYQPIMNVPAHNRLRATLVTRAGEAYEQERMQDFAKLALMLNDEQAYARMVAIAASLN